jgi:hypothetical protein
MLLRLGGLFFLVTVLFWLWAIFDAITAPEDQVRVLPKRAWILLVLIGLEFGAAAWTIFGRPKASAPTGPRAGAAGMLGSLFDSSPNRPGGSPRRRPPAPKGPDDDEEFLRGL